MQHVICLFSLAKNVAFLLNLTQTFLLNPSFIQWLWIQFFYKHVFTPTIKLKHVQKWLLVIMWWRHTKRRTKIQLYVKYSSWPNNAVCYCELMSRDNVYNKKNYAFLQAINIESEKKSNFTCTKKMKKIKHFNKTSNKWKLNSFCLICWIQFHAKIKCSSVYDTKTSAKIY